LSAQEAGARLRQNPTAVAGLRGVLAHCLAHAPASHVGRIPHLSGPLTIHSQYTRDEILVGLGHWSIEQRPDQREGVLHLPQSKVDAFFVTLQKTEYVSHEGSRPMSIVSRLSDAVPARLFRVMARQNIA